MATRGRKPRWTAFKALENRLNMTIEKIIKQLSRIGREENEVEKQCFIYTTKRVRRDDVTMTKMTSARAAKELRSLNDQRDALLNREKKTSAFTAALQEDIESVRPNYNFEETQNQLQQIEDRVRRLKHSVNHFKISNEAGNQKYQWDEYHMGMHTKPGIIH